MSQTYFSILTEAGEAMFANATALGIPVKLTHISVGDGGGNLPTPDRKQSSLVNEQRRAPLNSLAQDMTNPGQFIAEQVIPEDVGGWWIREIGLHDESGTLCAIANCPPSYKPKLAEGSGRTQVVRMVFLVGSADAVELKIDPSVVLATRQYCDSAIATELDKRDGKQSVRAATNAKLAALHGLLTVDGVRLKAADRVLVKDQAAGKDNGIYVATASAWARASDADAALEVTPGMLVPVEEGTANGDSVWQLVTDGPIVIGNTALAFEMAAGRTGVTAGTYRSVTVDPRGRVTGGSNPTTLAGYGITDAEPALGFTPVQQGGGVFQGTNKVKLGWAQDGSGLKVTVDTSDQGYLVFRDSPAFIGTPSAPTPPAGDNSTRIATTAFFVAAMAAARKDEIGRIVFEARAGARAGYMKLNGTLLFRADYPLLWAYAQSSGALVTEAEWQAGFHGCFSSGDGATTFRIPDFRGESMRFWDDGRGVDSGRRLGSWQDSQNRAHAHGAAASAVEDHVHSGWTDAQGNHFHEWGANNLNGVSSGGGAPGNGGSPPNHTSWAGNHGHNVGIGGAGKHSHHITIYSDGGAEVRVRNVAVCALIRAY
ncbi:phage tail protein [Cupriavidus sp. 2MCAB6]|uniref:phage tail-collar fiber domain-containing protein n=1 Tax=Cupriavidus sp. 2MCAB6 TaxID=3232981 RepID=UPI003F8E2C94